MSRPTRLHVAIGVSDLEVSRAFYEKLFGREPTKEIEDQVDWILNDPAVNFSIFYNPERQLGPEHVGQIYGLLFSANIPSSLFPVLAGLTYDLTGRFDLVAYAVCALLLYAALRVLRNAPLLD